MELSIFFIIPFLATSFSILANSAEIDNKIVYNDVCIEDVCGPIVSKCLLLESCNCLITPTESMAQNCSCCKQCVACLGEMYHQCCSCVGLCEPNTAMACLSLRSSVDYLYPNENQLMLYKSVTETPIYDYLVKTIPISEADYFKALPLEFRDSLSKVPLELNCTVVFMKKCMPNDECHNHCKSLGASAIRWFHTGCCQCVGQFCVDFGINENLCQECRHLEYEKDSDQCKQGQKDGFITKNEL